MKTKQELAKKYIKEFKECNFKSKDLEIIIDEETLTIDPKMKTIKSEFNKIGFDLLPTSNKYNWKIVKI